MARTTGHSWVVASGRCLDCDEPVIAAGPLGHDDVAPGRLGWLAPPFVEPTESRTCATGAGHRPGHATGTCAGCGASLEALDGTWFITVPALTHH